jgi:Smg protein
MKENESVLGVLMYLFYNHMEKDNQINLNDMELIDDLKSAGFHAHNIGKAFRWLHHLVEFAEQDIPPTARSFRVFSEKECWLMSTECRNFILSLEQQGILTPLTREVVIHQTLELINEGVDLNLLKWVTLMVLFNMPNCDTELSHMEFLVLSHTLDSIH